MRARTGPGAARRLLSAVLPPDWRESIVRDVDEVHERVSARRGSLAARLWYWGQVVSFAARFGADRLRGEPLVGASDVEGATAVGRGSSRRPRLTGQWSRDARYAVRTLVKSPVVAVVSVVSLALGIAASTTVFTVAGAFLERDPGPLGEAERVVAIYTEVTRGRPYDETSFQDYLDIAALPDVFEAAGAVRMGVLDVISGEARERVVVELVTGNWFEVLGVSPQLGRSFSAEETVIGNASPVMVLSHSAWVDRYGSDPGVIGRTVDLDGRTYTVIGVGPAGLAARFLGMQVDGWLPLGIPGGTYHATPKELADRRDRDYTVFARLRPGVTQTEASGRLAALATSLRTEHPEVWSDEPGQASAFTVLPVSESRIPPDGRLAMTALAIFGLGLALMVLLVACANVGGILSARAHRRGRELAIRASLGASRGRLVRLLLTESVLLAVTGGAIGVALAYRAARYLAAMPLPFDAPIRLDTSLDATVLVFAVAISAGAAIFAGLVPALRGSRPVLQPALRGDEAVGRRRRFGFQRVLTVVQVAVASMLVATTALAIRSVQASSRWDAGLDPSRVAVAWKSLPSDDMAADAARRYYLDLAERLESLPEIDRVVVARNAEAYFMLDGTSAARVEAGSAEPAWVSFNSVTPGYMEVLGMRLLRGRSIGAADAAGAPPVAVVNQAFVDRYWPGSIGLGESFRVSEWRDFGTPQAQESRTLEVVGVVANRSVPGAPVEPLMWTSFLQDEPVYAVLHARSRTTAEALVPILYRELEFKSEETVLMEPGPYATLIARRFVIHRVVSGIFGAAGVFALALAVMGVYGIVSFAVGRRFREMAIRQAVGASRGHTARSLVGEGMRLAAVGIAVGLAGAAAIGDLARSELNGISPADPLAIGGAVLLLLLGAFAASAIPARRLLHIQPMNVLRED